MKVSTTKLINISPPSPLKRINRKGGEDDFLQHDKSAQAPSIRQSQQIHDTPSKAGSQRAKHGGKFRPLPVPTNGQERTVSGPRGKVSRQANRCRNPADDVCQTNRARKELEQLPYGRPTAPFGTVRKPKRNDLGHAGPLKHKIQVI